MAIMLPSAKRGDDKIQPGIKIGFLNIRLPFIHAPWEIPEMIQAIVVFVTGVSATVYLEDIFGLPFSVALSIVIVQESFDAVHNILGDSLISGWITPAIPLVSSWLLTIDNMRDRIEALISVQLIVGIIYILFGLTGIAAKLLDWVPNSVKAGILIGAGMSAIIGNYGFMPAEEGGVGFFKYPVSFSIGVVLSFFLIFSVGFKHLRDVHPSKLVAFIAKIGFVPALLLAYLIGVLVKEIPLPVVNLSDGIFFNPIPGLVESFHSFSMAGLGPPRLSIFLQSIPMGIICYIIAFGDIVAGAEYMKSAESYRPDEIVDINANRSNILVGVRNILQGLFFPTVTLSGPCWDSMQVVIAERYKAGKNQMYSFFGGIITFNLTKAICCMIIPMIAFVQPIFPLAMSLTLMIQAFACFFVALEMVSTNEERGVAGMVGGILAIAPPHIGMLAGLVIAIAVQYLYREKNNH
ncbi:permease family protein [Vagococcus acidifermentans]|uniref:Xanthine/uracil/vitamin C permease n=1 Tax=Vagococcus acidifermentans TaxID=564710 RepID=A0A430B2U9_9ENTE|nr:hypothetical protein [Vagococcus acidifermentans]RSU14629.1 hypothetical protein CBF27_01195 [Vagococcus acidifermentans]